MSELRTELVNAYFGDLDRFTAAVQAVFDHIQKISEERDVLRRAVSYIPDTAICFFRDGDKWCAGVRGCWVLDTLLGKE